MPAKRLTVLRKVVPRPAPGRCPRRTGPSVWCWSGRHQPRARSGDTHKAAVECQPTLNPITALQGKLCSVWKMRT